MPLYKNKPTQIEAIQFTDGMEDGYNCYDLSGRFIGYFDKKGAVPKTSRKHVVIIDKEKHEIGVGDYITKPTVGNSLVFPKRLFEQNYELA